MWTTTCCCFSHSSSTYIPRYPVESVVTKLGALIAERKSGKNIILTPFYKTSLPLGNYDIYVVNSTCEIQQSGPHTDRAHTIDANAPAIKIKHRRPAKSISMQVITTCYISSSAFSVSRPCQTHILDVMLTHTHTQTHTLTSCRWLCCSGCSQSCCS